MATLAVAGCGGNDGGGDGDDTQGGTLTHAAFTARANAACKSASATMTKLKAPASLAGLADYADRARAIGVSLEGDLAAIEPPAADRSGLDRYRAALRAANTALTTMQQAAADNDRTGVQTAVERIGAAQVGILATQAGLGTCATATEGPAS
jgi:hypothetical protein